MDITLDPNGDKKKTLSIFKETAGGPYNPEYEKTIAERSHLALGQDSPGVDVLQNSVRQGDMARYEELAQRRNVMNFEETKLQLARDVVRQSEGREPNQDEVDAIMGLSLAQAEAGNAETVIQENFAKKYISTAMSADIEDDSIDTDPEVSNRAMDIAESAVTRNVIAQDKLSQIQKDLNDQGIFDKAWDFAEQLVPFKSMYNFHDLVNAAPTSSILTGNNLEEQIAYLHTLPPKEFKEQFEAAAEELRGRNTLDALAFAQAVIAYSSSDKFWANAQDVADVISFAAKPAKVVAKGIARAAGRGVEKALPKVVKKMQGAVRGAVHAPDDIAAAAAHSGHIAEAAKIAVTKDLAAGKIGPRSIETLKDLERVLPEAMSPNKTWFRDSSLPPAAVTRLQDLAAARTKLIGDALTKPNLLDVDLNTVQAAVEDASNSLLDTFKHVQHNVVNTRVNPAENSIANVNSVTIQFGTRDGALFKSEEGAKTFSRQINAKTNDFEIKQYPGGWAVEVTKNTDEMRNVTIDMNTKHPDNITSAFMGYLRSANDQVSVANRQARSTATLSVEHLGAIVTEMVKPFGKMGRQGLHELEDVIYNAQTKLNKANANTGIYYKTAGEFEQAFYDLHGKNPNVLQTDAYFTYVDLQDLDYVVRTLDTYKQKVRIGIENFEVGALKFEGKELSAIPYATKTPFRIRVVDDKGAVISKMYSRQLDPKKMKDIDEKVASGEYKILQSTDGTVDIDGDAVQIIVAKGAKRGRIDPKQFTRQEGGHQIQKNRFHVKQAVIRAHKDGGNSYLSDNTLFNASSAAEAREFADLYDTVRRLWKTDRPAAIKLINDKMPFDAKTFAGKVLTKQIDLDTPIASVRSGQSVGDVLDLSKSYGFLDNHNYNELNLSRSVKGRYLGERSESLIDQVTKEANGVFSVEQAPLVRPLEALQSTTADMIRTRVIHDYIHTSAKSWYNQFAHLLDVTKEEMASFGDDILVNPKWKMGANPVEVGAAENVRKAIVNLYTNSTPYTRYMNARKEKIVESVYNRFGKTTANWVSESLLPFASDIPTYLRSVAFHSKLGLFNVKQLFLQASSFSNVVAISPRSGAKAVGNLPLIIAALRKSNINDAKRIGAKAMGWTEDQFAAGIEAYRRSGYNIVAGDVAYVDEVTKSVAPIASQTGKVLDAGTKFFSTGERMPRVVGYFASYDEWLKANPGKLLDRRAQAAILDRAKLISGNMTRDASSRWQKGWMGSVTQFFGYQARMAELMIGKRLTGAERARLFTANALMYGLPVGVSAATGIVPWRPLVKQWMLEEGYDYNEDPLVEASLDGVISSLVEWTTGRDYDVSGSFGPGGISNIYDIWNGDAEVRDLLLGASGSIAMDIYESAMPALRGIWSAIDLDDQTYYPIDVTKILTNISSINNASKIVNISNLGKWLSRNGTILSDADMVDGYVSVLFGITPDRISDAFNQIDAMKSIDADKAALRKEISRDLRLAMKQDKEKMDLMIIDAKNRMVEGGFTPNESKRIWDEVLSEVPLDEAIAEKFTKKVKK